MTTSGKWSSRYPVLDDTIYHFNFLNIREVVTTLALAIIPPGRRQPIFALWVHLLQLIMDQEQSGL